MSFISCCCRLLCHICRYQFTARLSGYTRRICINSMRPSDAYMHLIGSIVWTAPSHYLNHCWNIVNWTLGNKLQWNFNRNSNIFIQENAFENVVCKMASICLGLNVLNECLYQHTWVNTSLTPLYANMWIKRFSVLIECCSEGVVKCVHLPPVFRVNSLRPSDAYICVGNLATIGSDNGLSPARRQAIIWTNAGILLIGPLGTNLSEILIGIQTFSFTKMHLKMSSAKRRPFCLGLNVLTLLTMATIRNARTPGQPRSLVTPSAVMDMATFWVATSGAEARRSHATTWRTMRPRTGSPVTRLVCAAWRE